MLNTMYVLQLKRADAFHQWNTNRIMAIPLVPIVPMDQQNASLLSLEPSKTF